MQLQNSFVVSSPVDKAWDFFLDVENIVPCMPGRSSSRPSTTRTGAVG
ncbi:hypothetical protein ACFQV4_04395 [Streptomyces thermocarboxydus]